MVCSGFDGIISTCFVVVSEAGHSGSLKVCIWSSSLGTLVSCPDRQGRFGCHWLLLLPDVGCCASFPSCVLIGTVLEQRRQASG